MNSAPRLHSIQRYLVLLGTVFCFCVKPLSAQWDSVLWVPQEVPVIDSPSHVWLDVFFLPSDPNYGWACGFGGNVTRTTTAGVTWQTLKLPVNHLESIHFVNELVGYVSGPDDTGGTIWRSVDGGATWRDITPALLPAGELNLWGCYFVDENVGVVIGGGCGVNQQFYRTTDGGASWQLFEQAEPSTGLADAILYEADGFGLAVSSSRLWMTQDGGRTWEVFANSAGSGMITKDWQEELTRVDDSFLLPVSPGCQGGTGNGVTGLLRFSEDFGNTWRQFATAGPMFGSFLLDAQRGWGVGQNKQVWYTLDAGRTWSESACGVLDGQILDDIWFIDDTTAWLAGTDMYKMTIYRDVPLELDTLGPLSICEGADTLVLIASEGYNYYEWSTGETSRQLTITSKEQVPLGKVTLTAYQDLDRCYAKTIEVDVLMYDSDFTIAAPDGTVFCQEESIRLQVPNYYGSYKWSNGATTSTITVSEGGTYSVSVGTIGACFGEADIEVVRNPRPAPVVVPGGPLFICEGESIVLATEREWQSYRWSNGTTARQLFVDTPGEYFVEVTNEFGCIGTSAVVVVSYDAIADFLEFRPSTTEGLQFSSIVGKLVCAEVQVINDSPTHIVNIDNLGTSKNVHFSVPPAQRRGQLHPGESIDITVCFDAHYTGNFVDNLYLFLDTLCAPQVPLSALVEPEQLQGASRCNIRLTGTIESLQQQVFVSPPYPQPATDQVVVEIAAFAHKPSNLEITYELRNFFGTLISSGRGSVSTMPLELMGQRSGNGEIVVPLHNVPVGSYILTLSYPAAHVSLPVLVIQ